MQQLFGLIFPITFIAFSIAERLWPARPLPRARGWFVKGTLFFALAGAIMNSAPLVWKPWANAGRLLDLESIGVLPGALVTIAVGNLVGYFWHRLRHESRFLWRWLHQLHHSAERLDMGGAFYFHPLDTLSVGLLTSALGSFVLGVTPSAAMLAGYLSFFCACLQHSNLCTPRWLGYIVQRPESHSIHHARGEHASNYCDLPLIDMLFGTFQNPPERAEELGFWDGASGKVVPMLFGRDVSGTGPAS